MPMSWYPGGCGVAWKTVSVECEPITGGETVAPTGASRVN